MPTPVSASSQTYTGADGRTYNQGGGGSLSNNFAAEVAPSSPGTTTANISTPANAAVTRPAPAVITSSAAQNDVTNKQTQFNQLQTDTQAHNQSMATSSQGNGAPPATNTTTPSSTQKDQQAQPAPSGGIDAQIQSILDTLNTGSDKIQTDASGQENQIMDAQASAQADQNAAYQQTAQRLSDIASGVYPLSPSEQNLLSATAQQFQSVLQAQATANQAYTGQMTELMASLGINTSAPTQAVGEIQSTINSGNSKIADINSKMAASLGTLSQGFQKQDYDMVQQSWEDAAKQFDDRQATLKSMLDSVTTQAKAATDELNTRTTTALTAIMDDNTINYQTKQLALQNAQLSETVRHDAADEANSRYEYTSDGQVFDKAEGKVIGQQTDDAASNPGVIGHTGNAIVDANTKHSAGGIPYVDGTNITGENEQSAQKVAAENGIPYLGKEQSSALASAETVRNNLASLQKVIDPIVAKGFLTRSVVDGANAVGGATQENQTIAAIDSYNATAIPLLKALSAGATNFRITQAELTLAQNKYLPSVYDTAPVIAKKIAYINGILDNGEQGIFGDDAYNKFKPDNSNPAGLSVEGDSGSPKATVSATNPAGI